MCLLLTTTLFKIRRCFQPHDVLVIVSVPNDVFYCQTGLSFLSWPDLGEINALFIRPSKQLICAYTGTPGSEAGA